MTLKPLILAALLGVAGASHAALGAAAAGDSRAASVDPVAVRATDAGNAAAWFDGQALAAAGQRVATAVAVPNDVPEPGTLALAALGLGVVALSARRRR